MKKVVLISILSFVLLALCGCTAEEQNNMQIKTNKAVTFVNEVNEADLWLLPKTQENLKTTVWGKATAAKVKKGESRKTPLCEGGDGGLYLFRMIDTDSMYYSAGDITLEAGWTMRIYGEDLSSITLEVTDQSGEVKGTYEVFAARL